MRLARINREHGLGLSTRCGLQCAGLLTPSGKGRPRDAHRGAELRAAPPRRAAHARATPCRSGAARACCAACAAAAALRRPRSGCRQASRTFLMPKLASCGQELMCLSCGSVGHATARSACGAAGEPATLLACSTI